ncbi:MAG: hypothetical protein JWQ02_942 [Capsulimonas sp.]|nr:hypothetical protein [Capsulimonas sp.]
MDTIPEAVERVETRQDFVQFVMLFEAELERNPKQWGENDNLRAFLGGVSGAAMDVDGLYANQDREFPSAPTWKLFAEILWMGAGYE